MPDLESIHSAVADTADLLGAACHRDELWPVLRAYEPGFTSGGVALRTTTRARRKGELSVRYLEPADGTDPYLLALDRRFTVKADHPVDRLHQEVQDHGTVIFNGVDVGAASGFEKIWSIYADDGAPSLGAMSRTPAMPPSVGGNLDYFARHGLTKVAGVGVDYRSRSVNVYFSFIDTRDTAKISAMFGDLGFHRPDGDELRQCRQAFAVYFTFTWDSPEVERVCFPIRVFEPELMPSHLDPLIERFVTGARFHGEDRAYVHAVTSSRHGRYYKVESFYHRPEPMIEADRRT
ncbi:aromatic prenyltransferase [Actinomadura sp. DC4]|uniref:aromatic prenyltransferase n=1 Tax=Actinomadura sp. DC4 TaxID=3055069 RepID=UPI0025B1D5B9|nr:aromatic prenyltransferase [Actinomadura sp. DC4]MDN3359629.1 aromatic prenyltransferase [Actinomadura sp. DC4]